MEADIIVIAFFLGVFGIGLVLFSKSFNQPRVSLVLITAAMAIAAIMMAGAILAEAIT